MKSAITNEELKRIADCSVDSVYRIEIERTVSAHFKNIRYMTSKMIVDCVLLNTLLNDVVTERSADRIIRYSANCNRAFHTNVESIYGYVSDTFNEYAKTVLGKDFDEDFAEKHTVRFIIYVLSVDCARNNTARREELFKRIYSYDELKNGFPHL